MKEKERNKMNKRVTRLPGVVTRVVVYKYENISNALEFAKRK